MNYSESAYDSYQDSQDLTKKVIKKSKSYNYFMQFLPAFCLFVKKVTILLNRTSVICQGLTVYKKQIAPLNYPW